MLFRYLRQAAALLTINLHLIVYQQIHDSLLKPTKLVRGLLYFNQ